MFLLVSWVENKYSKGESMPLDSCGAYLKTAVKQLNHRGRKAINSFLGSHLDLDENHRYRTELKFSFLILSVKCLVE